MSNSIEWSHASMSVGIVDPDDIPSTYEGLSEGEMGVWLGSDGANILYGTPEEMIALAERLRELAYSVDPRMVGPVDDDPDRTKDLSGEWIGGPR